MFRLNSISSQLLFTTVRIEAQGQDGNTSVGTGFIFGFDIDKREGTPILVTNRHVIEGSTSCRFRVHVGTTDSEGRRHPSGQTAQLGSLTTEDFWKFHPSGVDLCAMPLGVLLNAAKSDGVDIFFRALRNDQIPDATELAEYPASVEVLMVGYPGGEIDEANNLPVLRRGSTASHPAVNYNRRSEGLLDIAVFPGSSGSPVIIYTPEVITANRVRLLGVTYQARMASHTGKLNHGTELKGEPLDVETLVPMHLAFYIKSAELHELIRVVRDVTG